MKFEKFKYIVDMMVQHHQKLDQAYKLGVDLIEGFSGIELVVSELWNQVLTQEGKDWLDWFLYEKGYIHDGVGSKELNAWDENKNLICEDLKGLYDYLTAKKYFRV